MSDAIEHRVVQSTAAEVDAIEITASKIETTKIRPRVTIHIGESASPIRRIEQLSDVATKFTDDSTFSRTNSQTPQSSNEFAHGFDDLTL